MFEQETMCLEPLKMDPVELLENAEVLTDSRLNQVKPIYWMDIRSQKCRWKSLILDERGTCFKSQRTTRWLVNRYCAYYGSTYDSWERYLRLTQDTPRKIYPYVCGRVVIFRIQRKNKSHCDWVNVTPCQRMVLRDQAGNLLVNEIHHSKSTVYLHYELTNFHQTRLTIALTNRRQSLTKQIAQADCLWNLWHYHLDDELTRRGGFFQRDVRVTPYSFLMSDLPDLKGICRFSNFGYHAIRLFIIYATLREYYSETPSNLYKEASKLLEKDKLDRGYILEALEDYAIHQETLKKK